MDEHIYPWKRFWFPRDAIIKLQDGGYLYRPDTEWADRVFGINGILLRDLSSIPCLILLGEPGMGKSEELRQQQAYTCDHLSQEVLWVDLNAYQEQNMLYRALFDDTTFQEWLGGTHHLHLFLDSFDEGLQSIPTLARFLSAEVVRYRDSLSRLSLRIACRAAEWPKTLENRLKELWRSENVQVFRLAPLRREDVRNAAFVHGLDGDLFLDEVDRKAAVPLANRPITLRFLLNSYSEQETFPSTRQALYEAGCRILCQEMNSSRRDSGFTGSFTARQRLAAAARLAYLMIFTNHHIVWNGAEFGDAPGESLQLYKCSGGTEHADGSALPVSENLLNETLSTSLFFSRGANQREWAHRTYAEFLAAYYLSTHQIPLLQVMMLLLHADESEHRLVPQLHDTAAWLATMQPAVFRAIMDIDPEVLLQSDIATASAQDRAHLVEALLTLQPEERLWNVNRNLDQHYKNFFYPDLAAQLAPVISDRDYTAIRRIVAIKIAEACHLQVLSSDLLTLALDPSEMHPVREAAVQAVAQIGDDTSKIGLKPLAAERNDDDPDDELKGHSLYAVWPAFLTAEELFAALTVPKRGDFFGAYRSFLVSQITPYLDLADLPVALRWINMQPSPELGSFATLAGVVVQQALEHLDRPEVLETLAHVFYTHLDQFGRLPGMAYDSHKTLLDDEDMRYRLLKTMLPLLVQQKSDPTILLRARPFLLLPKDIPWLIVVLEKEQTEATQQMIVHLIRCLLDSDDETQVEVVLKASERFPMLDSELAQIFRPVTLGSPAANQMKFSWSLRHAASSSQELPPSLPEQPSVHLEQLERQLDTFRPGNHADWLHIVYLLKNIVKSAGQEKALNVDLTTFQSWRDLDLSLQTRFVEAAKSVLLDEGSDPNIWSELDMMHHSDPGLACYLALYLVTQKDPEFLGTISRDVWKRLIPVILVFGLLIPDGPADTSNSEAQRRLVAIAHHYASDELLDDVVRLLEREQWNCTSTYWNLLHNLEEVWDTSLENVLLEKASDPALAPECTGSLLGILLVHRVEQAKLQAETLLALPLPVDERERSRAEATAEALFRFSEDAGWAAIWPAMQSNSVFGKRLVAKMAYLGWEAQQLSPEQLADLYLWVILQHTSVQQVGLNTPFIAGVVDNIARWREELLQRLKDRGTKEACYALAKLANQVPEQERDKLQWMVLEAQTLTRQRTWTPYDATNLLQVVWNRQLRLVQNAEQLLEAVIESLCRLEATFHDEAPAWRDVWDRIPVKSPETLRGTRRGKRRTFAYQPIDENEFSDYVKRHLQADLSTRGIIANREVVIRADERIDIRIDALPYPTEQTVNERLSLIVEVKGCWHRELMTAMQTQLVNRYLRENSCHYGLYLVGWFNCKEWSGDYRKYQVPCMTIENAQDWFNKQAAELSQRGVTIRALLLDASIRERND
jgi:hypothetical protein